MGVIKLIKVITSFKRCIRPTFTQLSNYKWVMVI